VQIGKKKPLISRGFFTTYKKIIVVFLTACFIRKKTLASIDATGVPMRYQIAEEIVLEIRLMSNL